MDIGGRVGNREYTNVGRHVTAGARVEVYQPMVTSGLTVIVLNGNGSDCSSAVKLLQGPMSQRAKMHDIILGG